MAETFRIPKGVQNEAKKALGWIADGHAGSGFTAVGKKRASDLASGKPISADTILRMYSFFKRHEVDKQAEGFNSGEDGFPSPGRVAWSAWGGDAGFTWSTTIRNQISKSARAFSLMASEEGDMAESTVPDLNEELTELLADVISFYFRAHGAHWNVKGADFSEYHKLFLKIYEDVYESIDPIAENLRKLGSIAPFTLGSFLALRTIEDASAIMQDPIALASDLLSTNDIILDELSDAFDCATMYGQQGIANFLAGRIDQHQFWKWQLTASLGQEVTQPAPDPLDAQGIDEDDVAEEGAEMPMPMVFMDDRSASGASDLPLAARDRAWDAAAADKRVQDWAGGENIDWAKYGKAFFYVDPEKKNLLGGYKLQFADIIDGTLTAIPRGIFAVAGVLQGARGGADIPADDIATIKGKVAAYYSRMAKEFEDDTIKAPFEGRASAARIGEGSFVSWNTSNGRARGKVEKVITKGQAKSSEGYVLETTPDQPAFSIRIYKEQGNGWVPSDVTVVHRPDILTVIKALPAPRSKDLEMIEERKTMIASAERITMNAEVRAMDTTDGSLKIAGYAATFNSEATGLNFREVIAPGAFKRTLSTENPVFLLVNHDMEQLPLASTKSGTLQLSEDKVGLRMEANLDPSNPRAQELASALKRGDVDKMSFAFTVAPGGDTREEGLRTLTDLDLYEVSIVTLPAYDSTSVGLRNANDDTSLRHRLLKAKTTQIRLRK